MRKMNLSRLCFSTLLVLVIAACATKKQVHQAVVAGNLALIENSVPGEVIDTNGWKLPVQQIDQIIANHPDQAVLVDQLRLRQAWILTVYKQENLASEIWSAVDESSLKTERDIHLYANRDALLWWFTSGSLNEMIDADDEPMVRQYLADLAGSVEKVKTREVDIYFATIRAQMAQKLHQGADVGDPAVSQSTRNGLSNDLSAFIGVFAPDDIEWVRQNPTGNDSGFADVATLRNRVFLRTMIKEYKTTAANHARDSGMPAPNWQPSWIGTMNFN